MEYDSPALQSWLYVRKFEEDGLVGNMFVV
jgi:hypothetical protein